MNAAPGGRVVVVGAGPTGLLLAAELALAGVPCRVFERAVRAGGGQSAVCLPGAALTLLDLRGYADRLAPLSSPVRRAWLNPDHRLELGEARELNPDHRLELGEARDRYPAVNLIRRDVLTGVLEARADQLGVEVIRGVEVTGVSQYGAGAEVVLRGPHRRWVEQAAYVVGCDGPDGVVRSAVWPAGTGPAPRRTGLLAEVRLAGQPADELMVYAAAAGVMVLLHAGEGWYRVYCLPQPAAVRPQPVRAVEPARPPSLAALAAAMCEVSGEDLGPYQPRRLAPWRLCGRVAAGYRVGRVLLAGAAADQHDSISGQDLTLGLADALNLGWKLAAVLHGWAPASLLDTYQLERLPAAAALRAGVEWAAGVLLGDAPVAAGVRVAAVRRLLGLPGHAGQASSGDAGQASSGDAGQASLDSAGQASSDNAGRLRLGDHRPVGGDGARLVVAGCRPHLLDVPLVRPDGSVVRPAELLRDGRFLLIDLGPAAAAAAAARGWQERVRTVVADADPGHGGRLDGVDALLLRPDGQVAWSTQPAAPSRVAGECAQVLTRWCGSPVRPDPVRSRGGAGPGTGHLGTSGTGTSGTGTSGTGTDGTGVRTVAPR